MGPKRRSTALREQKDAERLERELQFIERALARGQCVSQRANDAKLRERSLPESVIAAYRPLFPHPMPVSYEKFEVERLLQKLSVLDPGERIMGAVTHRSAWCVEALFLSGCPVQSTEATGLTALHKAAALGDEDTVRALLNIGSLGNVDVNAESLNGTTPLASAKGAGQKGCADLIERAGGVVELRHNLMPPANVLDAPIREMRTVGEDEARWLNKKYAYCGQF